MIGLVENMGTSVCRSCGIEAPLFQEADVIERARELDVEVLARVPFDTRLAAAGDAGRPLEETGSRASRAFAELAERVAGFEPTRPAGETR